MVNLVWQEVVIKDLEFKGVVDSIEVEDYITDKFDREFNKKYKNSEVIINDFKITNENKDKIEMFDEDTEPLIEFYLEIYVDDEHIKNLNDITEKWLESIVKDSEDILTNVVTECLHCYSLKNNMVFTKAYYEEY